MKLNDAVPGSTVYTQECMGDDRSGMEIREVFYLVDQPRQCREHHVAVALLGIIQGEKGLAPRYVRVGKPCRDPGEADGRVVVRDVMDGKSVWLDQIKGSTGK